MSDRTACNAASNRDNHSRPELVCRLSKPPCENVCRLVKTLPAGKTQGNVQVLLLRSYHYHANWHPSFFHCGLESATLMQAGVERARRVRGVMV